MHNDPEPTDAAAAEERASLTDIFRFAMMQKLCVSVTYNNMEMLIAPHMLWTKHGDLHVDAVTVERAGGVPKISKIGTFKLAGLSRVALTARQFRVHPDWSATDPKYDEARVARVER